MDHGAGSDADYGAGNNANHGPLTCGNLNSVVDDLG